METAQLNHPSPQPMPTGAESLAPEMVEDLPVKIPAGGQHFSFREENPFKAPTQPAKLFQRPTAPVPLPQPQFSHQFVNQNQAATVRKPVAETILVIALCLILTIAAIILLR